MQREKQPNFNYVELNDLNGPFQPEPFYHSTEGSRKGKEEKKENDKTVNRKEIKKQTKATTAEFRKHFGQGDLPFHPVSEE